MSTQTERIGTADGLAAGALERRRAGLPAGEVRVGSAEA
jgi:hypothetical protein